MRFSSILAAIAGITILSLTLPAAAGKPKAPPVAQPDEVDADGLLDELFEEVEIWLDECGGLLTGDPVPKHCAVHVVDSLDEVPISEEVLRGATELLDDLPVSADAGIVRCLGVVDTIPPEHRSQGTAVYDIEELDGPAGPPVLLVVLVDAADTTGGMDAWLRFSDPEDR